MRHKSAGPSQRIEKNGFLSKNVDRPALYQIKLLGRLGLEWSSTFDDFELRVNEMENGQAVTVMCGKVTDQAALHGLLNQIRDIGMVLLLVERYSV